MDRRSLVLASAAALGCMKGRASFGATGPVSFANVAALRANRAAIQAANLQGYDVSGDGGGGPLQVSGDQTLRDNGFTVFADARGVKYVRTGDVSNGYPITWAGVKPSGNNPSLNTARLMAAIAAGLPLYVPSGNYAVELGRLRLGDRTVISGAKTGSSQFTASGPANPKTGSDKQSLFYGMSVSGVRISDLTLNGTNSLTIGIGIFGQNSSDWTVQNVHTRFCRLAYVYCPGSGGKSDYANTTGQNMGRDIHFNGCTGLGDKANVGNDGAWLGLSYIRDWSVTNCKTSWYLHGINWWGGDAAASADGALANERKCFNGKIQDCSVTNIGAGGIWGSMGRNIQVSHCRAETCGDVCFDAEGSQDIVFSNCAAKNGGNGCLTTFWFNRNVVFQDCNVEMSGGCTVGFRSYNASLDSVPNQSVSILGGSMVHRDGTGVVDQARGPIHSFTMRGTNLRDVVVNMSSQNVHDVTIDAVKSVFTRAIPNGLASAAIVIGNIQQDGAAAARAAIRNCDVRSLVQQPYVERALALVGSDVNTIADSFEASGNLTTGFRVDLIISDTAGTRANYQVTGNRFGSGRIDLRGKTPQSPLRMDNH
jgi:hypothetical protein